MDRLKILAIIGRLIFATESDGLTCRIDSVAIPPWNVYGAAIVDCIGKGRFRTFTVYPSGRVTTVMGRAS